MVSRTQIERISQRVARVAVALESPGISYVTLYPDESDEVALAAYRDEFGIEPIRGYITFNRGRPGDTRTHSKASGIYLLHCLGSGEVRQVLDAIDGRTRGIPVYSSLTGERGSTA